MGEEVLVTLELDVHAKRGYLKDGASPTRLPLDYGVSYLEFSHAS
jgi:hypothetical protein